MKTNKLLIKTKKGLSKDIQNILPDYEPKLNKSRRFIPVCAPDIRGNELKYVKDCLSTNWISSAGSYVKRFENSFSHACQTKYGVSCSSGTAALHLALASLGIGPGDEVIVPTFTMIATANTVVYTGAKPVFVDADQNTWNIDSSLIEKSITKKTKAIIVVHTYGYPADMETVVALARKHCLFVIEDACEAHGATYKGKSVGSLADVACFSFYGNKILTTGEGGMLVTNKKNIADIARTLRDHGFSKRRHFWHEHVGFNYRMTNLQAAIGLAQTERINQLVRHRIENAKLYKKCLKGIKGIVFPPESSDRGNVFWLYTVLIEKSFKVSRNNLRCLLADEGIETRPVFIPVHLQPVYYQDCFSGHFPVAEDLCSRGLCLPSAGLLLKKHIELIAGLINKYSDQR
ncbi:MAG: DegT/DnrJ/EryC1/StrS family aminotransferase [Candidatus Omnitrophica bacterium]|nr:DegT/DnrJ/EryC1/StrS family aminotransferase [Candidatus Omnitrophota bacterium]